MHQACGGKRGSRQRPAAIAPNGPTQRGRSFAEFPQPMASEQRRGGTGQSQDAPKPSPSYAKTFAGNSPRSGPQQVRLGLQSKTPTPRGDSRKREDAVAGLT